MKKAVLTAINKIKLIEVPKPSILNGNDVLVKMSVVGICGSDIHYYSTGKIGSQVVDYPFCLGHEGAGVVDEVGDLVSTVKKGDRIAVEPAKACGECDQCLAGRPHTCRNGKFLGCPGQIEGNLAEYIIIAEDQCLKLDDGLLMEHGATSEPLSIGLYATQQAGLIEHETIGIIGFGPIGVSVFQMAKAQNISKIYISEKIAERGLIAKKLGAKWVGNPTIQDIEKEITAIEPLLLDVVFECCGQQDAVDTAIEILKPGGKLVIVGIPEFDRWSFSADKLRRKEITVINIRRQNNCTHKTLNLMQQGEIDGSAMITHRFPFDKIEKAFELVKNYRDGVMKAMVEF